MLISFLKVCKWLFFTSVEEDSEEIPEESGREVKAVS